MNCTACLEHLADLADGRLDGDAAAAIRGHLESCASCREEFLSLAQTLGALDALPALPPSHRMRAAIAGHIEAEKLTQRSRAEWASSIRSAAHSGRRRSFPWLGAALGSVGACALVSVGYVIGDRSATERQVADLRARVDTIGQLVDQSVLHNRTTGDRIETVLTAAGQKYDARTIDGLVNSMAFDPSVNVRLSALDALYAHADQDVVRAAVLACLPKDPNPLVQVSMIDFLVAARAHDASPELQKLMLDMKANSEVRESARRAVDEL